MVNVNQKEQQEGKSGINTTAAVVTGAVIGAGIAIAGAVALKKENRQKVKKALVDTKDNVENYIKELQKEAQDKIETLEDKNEEGKEEVEKQANTVKNSESTRKKK